MAHNQNNKNSEGACEKFYNAVSGGRKIRLLSQHIQGSVSSKTSPKSQVQTSDSPGKTSFPGKKPVFLHQPSHGMIPVEFEAPAMPSPMSQKENAQPTVKDAGKHNNSKRVPEISVREIVINGEGLGLKEKMENKTNGQVEKVHSMKDRPPGHVPMEGKTKLKARMASMLKIKSTKDEAMLENGHEGKKTERKKSNNKFSDYIDHVKTKLGTHVSNIGGPPTGAGGIGGGGSGGVGRTSTRRDSFNNRVSSYINRAKMKIRTTTNFDGKSNSFK